MCPELNICLNIYTYIKTHTVGLSGFCQTLEAAIYRFAKVYCRLSSAHAARGCQRGTAKFAFSQVDLADNASLTRGQLYVLHATPFVPKLFPGAPLVSSLALSLRLLLVAAAQYLLRHICRSVVSFSFSQKAI